MGAGAQSVVRPATPNATCLYRLGAQPHQGRQDEQHAPNAPDRHCVPIRFAPAFPPFVSHQRHTLTIIHKIAPVKKMGVKNQ